MLDLRLLIIQGVDNKQ